MSLLTDLASSTSVLIFGPPPPVQKDPPPKPITPPAPTSPASIKAALLRPNLGLSDLKAEEKMLATKACTKHNELPLPPPPDPEHGQTASSILISTGASAMSFLGSAVLNIGSAAVSALGAVPEEADGKASPSKDVKVKHTSASSANATMLGSLSTALLTHAASVRDAAIGSVTSSAASLASTATHVLTDAATSTLDYATGRTSSTSTTNPPEPRTVRRAATLPVQLTATGEPFSSDPSISAMQRIPDHSCPPRHALTHCCSAPDVLTSLAEEEHAECTCKCYTAIDAEDANEIEGYSCMCHEKSAYAKGQSGHFHRVEQLVKGTKRVVRDIKNVL
ncbi:hypothetical protein EX895_001989 [Sporisorium graminicola]|uniref:Uncharacterized protein n=1 Tax=Sporisorium graminicola TaxID=280036 RepID=A0A4U7L135_9BASI|nr:hypothetical protein EX895_001989 [Sporisorium graminicola]TKY89458.1 hypothetical protein EX895_001989 [Sporisorium graminicola]